MVIVLGPCLAEELGFRAPPAAPRCGRQSLAAALESLGGLKELRLHLNDNQLGPGPRRDCKP